MFSEGSASEIVQSHQDIQRLKEQENSEKAVKPPPKPTHNVASQLVRIFMEVSLRIFMFCLFLRFFIYIFYLKYFPLME